MRERTARRIVKPLVVATFVLNIVALLAFSRALTTTHVTSAGVNCAWSARLGVDVYGRWQAWATTARDYVRVLELGSEAFDGAPTSPEQPVTLPDASPEPLERALQRVVQGERLRRLEEALCLRMLRGG